MQRINFIVVTDLVGGHGDELLYPMAELSDELADLVIRWWWQCGEIQRPVASPTKHPIGHHRVKRFHKTMLHEFYQVAFRKKIYRSLDELQTDLDAWLIEYNERRTHQGKMCCGRTPLETFDDGIKIWRDKQLGQAA